MKIEIDLSDLESLRQEVYNLQKKNEELITKLNSFSDKEFNNKVEEKTELLLKNILDVVYKKLGFEPGFAWDSINIANLKHYLGKDWVNSERLNVELEVYMTTQFKKLLLKMGIKTDDESEKK